MSPEHRGAQGTRVESEDMPRERRTYTYGEQDLNLAGGVHAEIPEADLLAPPEASGALSAQGFSYAVGTLRADSLER